MLNPTKSVKAAQGQGETSSLLILVTYFVSKEHALTPGKSLSLHQPPTRLILSIVFITAWGSACSLHENRDDSKPGNIQLTRPIFYPEARGPFPGILVLPMAGSPTSAHADRVAKRLAKEGYVARAMSYGEATSGGLLKDPKKLERLKNLTSQSLASLRIQPGVDSNRIGVIGFSLGGFFATYLASSAAEMGLRAAVVYYGIYNVPEQITNLRVPILAFQGDADPYRDFIDQASAMQRIAMNIHKRFELIIYRNAGHGFDYDASVGYNTGVAEDAWRKTVAFLDENVRQR